MAEEVSQPGYLIKLCGQVDELLAILPAGWRIVSESWIMAGPGTALEAPLPPGYRLSVKGDGPVTLAEIEAPDGTLAARGYAAENEQVFIVDRIRTQTAHQRLGLGRALMTALCKARQDDARPEILTATDEGRLLYLSLGWRVLSPYVTAELAP
ncbi:MAG: GNAT family N-acetyltransferase [Novosphingobium sp.]